MAHHGNALRTAQATRPHAWPETVLLTRHTDHRARHPGRGDPADGVVVDIGHMDDVGGIDGHAPWICKPRRRARAV